MAVTKAQLAQWNREFEQKHPDKVKASGNATSTAAETKTKTERVSRSQLAQWSAEFDTKKSNGTLGQNTAAADSDLYAAALADYRAKNNLGFADEMDSREDRLNGTHGVVMKRAEAAPLTASSPAAKLSVAQKWDTALKNAQQQAWEQKLADLPNLVRETVTDPVPDSTMDVDWNGTGIGSKSISTAETKRLKYTEDDLKKMGFTQAQIDLARTPAQGLKASYDKYNQPEEFDRLNQWYDKPGNRQLVQKLQEQSLTEAPEDVLVDWNGTGVGVAPDQMQTTGTQYTDDDLKKMGYSTVEIEQARNYLEEMAKIPEWKKNSRRASNFVGGIVDSMAGGGMMTAETGVQGAKNIADTQKNWAKVRQEIAGDERAEKLFDLLTDVDMDYNPTWPESRNRELVQMGYGSEEIRNMRQRLAGLEVNTGIDKDRSIGYQLYARGQNLSGAAQSGLDPAERAIQGVVGSAAENLAISSINPAAVLPLLSLQGASDAMGQSIEKGDSAGKTFAEGMLKFGAGWGINSVGTADLARTMGSDYAKDTVAGKISELVRTIAGQAPYAEQYPAIANAVSGGIDNAAQAFIETYADKAVDAALGDPEAAQTLFSKQTLLDAMEAGLTGGASGALGGAVGTGLAKLNAGNASLLGNAEYYAAEAAADGNTPHQSAAQTASPQGEAFAVADSGIVNETQVNDDPAEHTAAQNASIAEYKNSVDPKMAEYVDKVRAGEKLEPYVVTKTSDRMRSAMMELTGLKKVGNETLLDENGVNHITNRHAGGDGSADATMKNSADVARAAYVLNNFDNAYLGTRKAEGYFDSRGKRAPIVIFEKKIDGSHIIVEAVTDTKRGKNYIISEYLSSVGVDPKEIAKTLRPPMDAAESDPRHTSETLNEEISAMTGPTETAEASASGNRSMEADEASRRTDTESVESSYRGLPGTSNLSIASTEGGVNGKSVENNGETVESTNGTAADGAEPLSQRISADSPPNSGALGIAGNSAQTEQSPSGRKSDGSATEEKTYADVENRVDAGQLDTADWNRGEQRAAARQLVSRAQMTTKAAQAVVDAMPEGVGAAVYAQAANSLYRLGIQEDVKSFEQAVNLTGGMNTLGGAVRQVLALGKTGENALRIAYTYGQGEAEAYNARKAGEIGGGSVALNPDAGTYFKGRSVSKGENALDAFIELGAKSSGSAIHRAVEGLQNNAKGLIKAAAGEMYLSGEAGSETVMHETFHMLNEWSPATGQAVMDRLLTYLVQQNGMESTEKLVQSYLDKYEAAGKKITWNQALEEITADAMETVFGTAEGFRNFVRQQAAEAKMNASARGMIGKVMDKIDSLLHTVLADVNRFLKKEPTNAAAKAAKSLTEEQLKDLQSLYFDHQIEAGSKYREALENGTETKNAAPSEAEDAAVKYSINPNYAENIENWDENGRKNGVRFILGRTGDTLQKLGALENDIYMNSDKINTILREHPEMTLEEIKRIPEILEHPVMVLSSQNKGRSRQNTRLVLFGNVKAQDGRPVLCVMDLRPVENHIVLNDMQKVTSAYTKDVNPVQFVRKSNVLFASNNKNETTTFLRTLGFKMPSELQRYGLIGSITYEAQEIKLNGVPFTELEGADGKYQLDVDSDAAEVTRATALGDAEKQTDLMRQVSELGGKVRLSDQSITGIVRAVLSDTGSKLDAKTFTQRIRALSDYIALTKDVNWDDVSTFAQDIAEQVMLKSSKKNDELWRQYKDLHQMSMTIEKGSKDYQEILYHWGSWANARKELARHGVKITQSKEGVHSRWDADFTELQKLGAGLFPTETPSSAVDALEAMAAAHDTIRPVMENAYNEDWDGAKQDIAMQILQRYMNSPEVANDRNAEARKEFAKQWEEVRKQARQEALEARAKAFIDQAKFAQELKAAKDAAASARKETAEAETRADLAGTQAKDKADLAQEFAKKQRDSVRETIQLAKDRAAKQLQKARDAREMDTTRRNIRKMTSQLTQMLEKPTEGSHVTDYMIDKVRPVAALANDAIGNHQAAVQLRAELNDTYGPLPAAKSAEDALAGLQQGIDHGITERAKVEWNQSGINEKISELLSDLEETRVIEMEKLRGEIENAEKWLKEDTPEKKAYLARLHSDLKAYQDGNLSTLTADQMRELSTILEQTLFLVKNENVMLGSIEDVMIDDFAEGVAGELADVRKKQKDTTLGKIFREAGSVYKLNTMNIERNFERLGGYHHGGFMEQLGQQLNQGQFKKERITAEGERIFANVTGPKNAEKLYHFTHDLVDIGLKTRDGKPWLVTHDVMAELWVQLQNKQGLHHLLYGGATIADMSLSTKGFAGLGQQYAETVTLGELVTTDKNGSKLNAYEISQREDALRTSLIGEIEKNLTEYDDLWISDFKELGKLTKGYINETSMALFGTKIARVDNYIRLHVDKNTLVEQNEGVKRDASVTNAGFTKNRQVSAKPLELVGLVRQASESIENTAQYAGMAVPLRNAEKVLNTMEDGKTLYGAIERSWGRAGRKYMTKAMADLTGGKGESEVFDHLSGKLRGAAAAAVLTGNLNVTLLQAASLPTAAAELGWGSTGASLVQFGKNVNPINKVMSVFGMRENELNAIVERAYRFGDSLLPTRLRGSSRGELSTAAKEQGVGSVRHEGARNSANPVLRYGTRAVDALADFAGGSIGWMDKVTVASLFHGSENYVKHHLAEYDLTKADLPTKALEDGSKAYQEAVMSKFQRVVERTQPNYTVMQRTGMQRSKNQMLKTVTMFSTQRQQNAQIMVSAVEDLKAQVSRNGEAQNALERAKASEDPHLAQFQADADKAKADFDTALGRFGDAVSSQIVQTALIAGLGVFVKFLLHRWDDLQDENGDMTVASVLGSALYQFGNSMVSNYVGGSEIWTAAESIHSKKMFGNYDSVSMTGFSAINDAVTSMTKLNALLDKDTSEMTDEELDAYAESVKQAWADAAGQLMMLKGVPYNNGKKYVQAVFAWMDTAKQWKETGERNFNSTPDSATGQYDRLFEAIETGNAEETKGATKKLERMLAEGKIKEDKTESQLKSRLKKYDEDILDAAKAKNAGDLEARKDAKQEVYDRLCAAYGVKKLGEKGETDEDKAQRNQFKALIDKAVDEKAEELYKGGTSGSVYDALKDAVESGKARDVQDEIKRLRTAGREDGDIKTEITKAAKEEYLAGNDRDRERLETMLLKLKKADGEDMYAETDFAKWVSDAEKKEEAAKNTKDEWAGLR